MLLHEECGRREYRHLLAGVRGDERGAHRHLGLAEADIAAHDAVHRAIAAEVGKHLPYRLRLVLGFLEWEGVGERLVVELAHRERESRLGLATRMQVEQLRGHIPNLLRGAPPRTRPLIGAELVQRRILRRRAGVAAHQMQRVHRHVDAVAVLVLEHQEFPGLAADLHRHQPLVAADAVFLVHHRRPGIEVLQVAQDRLGVGGALAATLLAGTRPEQLRLGDHRDRRHGGEGETLDVRRDRQRQARLGGEEGTP